ncbi:hypothetical protein J4233_03230 [Candidatus Pacearchaeota archaeon]|nr:hypothetical protein [Candidatus Pacearchaeota archaeon]
MPGFLMVAEDGLGYMDPSGLNEVQPLKRLRISGNQTWLQMDPSRIGLESSDCQPDIITIILWAQTNI